MIYTNDQLIEIYEETVGEKLSPTNSMIPEIVIEMQQILDAKSLDDAYAVIAWWDRCDTKRIRKIARDIRRIGRRRDAR